MPSQEELQKLQRQSREYWAQMKALLEKQVQPWNDRAPGRGGLGMPKHYSRNMEFGGKRGESFQTGVAPSDYDVQRFINASGGNPYEKRIKTMLATTDSATAPNGGPGGLNVAGTAQPLPDPTQMFQQMMAAQQGKLDEANAANIKRYDEGHGELTGVRTRNQDRVQNWGKAASADIEERMQEALLDSEASLAARGLGGSTIQDAFRLRKARDVANEQQRISEMRDSRASEYDTRDTGNLVGFVERREDTGPDANMLLQMAMQFGQGQQQLQAQKEQQARLDKLLADRGTGGRDASVVSPGPQGGVRPFFAGPNPLQLAAMMYGGGGPRMMQQQQQQQSQQPLNVKQAQQVMRAAPGAVAPAMLPGMGVAGIAAAMMGGLAPTPSGQPNKGKQRKAPTPGAWAKAQAESRKKKFTPEEWMTYYAQGGK
jgi:hypothetical protein